MRFMGVARQFLYRDRSSFSGWFLLSVSAIPLLTSAFVWLVGPADSQTYRASGFLLIVGLSPTAGGLSDLLPPRYRVGIVALRIAQLLFLFIALGVGVLFFLR